LTWNNICRRKYFSWVQVSFIRVKAVLQPEELLFSNEIQAFNHVVFNKSFGVNINYLNYRYE